MSLVSKLQKPNVQPAALILLLGLTLVLLPHFSHLPLWLIFTVSILIFWRGAYELQLCQIPSKRILFILTLMLLAGIIFSYHTLIGRNAGTAMLLGLLCLKLFEIKSYRDIAIIINLALFSIVINFLFDQSIFVALIMLLALVFLFTALVSFQHDYKSKSQTTSLETIQQNEKQHFVLATKMLAQAVPFAIVLFIIFPRVNGPLWGLPEDAFSATTGLSDDLSPGRISQLSDSPAVAFRVEFHSPVPAADKLYWRGPVMWNFNGYDWTAPIDERIALNQFDFTALAEKTTYTITLEPHNKFWMFGLDLPSNIPLSSQLSIDMQVLSVLPIQKLQRYKMSSFTDYVLPAYPKTSFQRYLDLPASNNLKQSRELINKLKDPSSAQNTVNNVLNYFSTQNFYYSRQPPLLFDDPVDEFLFKTKSGYCEHYASSFTVLMRLAGIPARVVTGYQGGELNPIDNYMTIRQSDAHAWSEVYLEGKGWTRVDPTASIPAENIENINDARRLNLNTSKPRRIFESSWLTSQFKNIRFAWDAVNNRWNQWVLGYNNKKQKAFFAAIGIPEISWQGLSQLLFSILGLLSIVLAFIIFSGSSKNKDEVQIAYAHFLKKMKKQGIVKTDFEGALDFSQRATTALPQHKKIIHEITQLYQQLRYQYNDPERLIRLKKKVKSF